MVYQSKPGAYFKQRMIIPAGEYDSKNILYTEGTSFGNHIFFDSRKGVMSLEEFQQNFEPMDGKGAAEQ